VTLSLYAAEPVRNVPVGGRGWGAGPQHGKEGRIVAGGPGGGGDCCFYAKILNF